MWIDFCVCCRNSNLLGISQQRNNMASLESGKVDGKVPAQTDKSSSKDTKSADKDTLKGDDNKDALEQDAKSGKKGETTNGDKKGEPTNGDKKDETTNGDKKAETTKDDDEKPSVSSVRANNDEEKQPRCSNETANGANDVGGQEKQNKAKPDAQTETTKSDEKKVEVPDEPAKSVGDTAADPDKVADTPDEKKGEIEPMDTDTQDNTEPVNDDDQQGTSTGNTQSQPVRRPVIRHDDQTLMIFNPSSSDDDEFDDEVPLKWLVHSDPSTSESDDDDEPPPDSPQSDDKEPGPSKKDTSKPDKKPAKKLPTNPNDEGLQGELEEDIANRVSKKQAESGGDADKPSEENEPQFPDEVAGPSRRNAAEPGEEKLADLGEQMAKLDVKKQSSTEGETAKPVEKDSDEPQTEPPKSSKENQQATPEAEVAKPAAKKPTQSAAPVEKKQTQTQKEPTKSAEKKTTQTADKEATKSEKKKVPHSSSSDDENGEDKLPLKKPKSEEKPPPKSDDQKPGPSEKKPTTKPAEKKPIPSKETEQAQQDVKKVAQSDAGPVEAKKAEQEESPPKRTTRKQMQTQKEAVKPSEKKPAQAQKEPAKAAEKKSAQSEKKEPAKDNATSSEEEDDDDKVPLKRLKFEEKSSTSKADDKKPGPSEKKPTKPSDKKPTQSSDKDEKKVEQSDAGTPKTSDEAVVMEQGEEIPKRTTRKLLQTQKEAVKPAEKKAAAAQKETPKPAEKKSPQSDKKEVKPSTSKKEDDDDEVPLKRLKFDDKKQTQHEEKDATKPDEKKDPQTSKSSTAKDEQSHKRNDTIIGNAPSPAATPTPAPAASPSPASSSAPAPTLAVKRKVTRSTTAQLKQRAFRRIPVFIVDYHNDVLQFLYRCWGARFLQMENNVLVHFDSHPDMVISNKIPASACYDKESMLSELSIENWIMPTCYTGSIQHIIWLKNSWCKQIPCGKYQFKVGQKNDRILVDSPLEYFISEGNYIESAELRDTRNIDLKVYDADTDDLNPNEFLNESNKANFILDIDLDFFSTTNPFLVIYREANCYNLLGEIFHFEMPKKQFGMVSKQRRQQLEVLEKLFDHLQANRPFDEFDKSIISAEISTKVSALIEALNAHYTADQIDWKLIYNAGSTIDSKGLPHHISTNDELKQYYIYFKQFLQRLPVPPVIITIACSATDDYCPKEQVNDIQENVMRVLREVFGDRIHDKPILQKADDKWDIMEL